MTKQKPVEGFVLATLAIALAVSFSSPPGEPVGPPAQAFVADVDRDAAFQQQWIAAATAAYQHDAATVGF